MPILKQSWRKLSNDFRIKISPKESHVKRTSTDEPLDYQDSSDTFIQEVFSPISFTHEHSSLSSASASGGSNATHHRSEDVPSTKEEPEPEEGKPPKSPEYGSSRGEKPPAIVEEEYLQEPEPECKFYRKEKKRSLDPKEHRDSHDDDTQPSMSFVREGNESAEVDLPTNNQVISRVPTELWILIANELDPCSAASVAYANRTLSQLLGPEVWTKLNRPENRKYKAQFLQCVECQLPNHVVCHTCAIYHPRQRPGKERLHDSPTTISHSKKSVTHCARAERVPSVRITFDVPLHFQLAHLVTRRHRHGHNDAWGIPPSALSKSWSPPLSDWTTTAEWFHRAKFAVDSRGHLLMKVTSTFWASANMTKSEQRLALSCRNDYTANYSTCPHEALGPRLFDICKCALNHIPSGNPNSSGAKGNVFAPPQRLRGQCARCLPLHRCSACPTEYKVDVQLKECRVSRATVAFRHAIVVTRWSDLGDVRTPESPEWRACASPYGSALTNEDDWAIFKVEGEGLRNKTIRNRFEYVTGGRLSDVDAVLLKGRSSTWKVERELMRDDGKRVEMFMRGY